MMHCAAPSCCRRRLAASRSRRDREGATITGDNPDLVEVREELEAKGQLRPIAIGFNPRSGSSS